MQKQRQTTSPAPGYTITDLGTLAGYGFEADAFSINNSGVIVGRNCCGSPTPPPAYEVGFSYLNGMLTNLGGVPGYSVTEPTGISSTGFISATSGTPGNQSIIAHTQAIRIYAGRITQLGFLPGDTESASRGVNDFGDVVGYSFNDTGGSPRAVLFHQEKAYYLGVGVATGVNDFGIAIGYGATNQATLFSLNHAPVSIGTLGGSYSIGEGINQRGEAVGYSALPVTNGSITQHGFAYYGGRMHDLGAPFGYDPSVTESDARGLNDLGEIVGTYAYAPGFQNTAFVYANGVMQDLTSLLPAGSGWTLSAGVSINDCGDIVGSGLHDGLYRAFVARPVHANNPRLRYALGCRRPNV